MSSLNSKLAALNNYATESQEGNHLSLMLIRPITGNCSCNVMSSLKTKKLTWVRYFVTFMKRTNKQPPCPAILIYNNLIRSGKFASITKHVSISLIHTSGTKDYTNN